MALIDKTINADLNEERKININAKRTNAFRKIYEKIKNGENISIFNGVKFFVAKAAQKLSDMFGNLSEKLQNSKQTEEVNEEILNNQTEEVVNEEPLNKQPEEEVNIEETPSPKIEENKEEAPKTSIFGNLFHRNKEKEEQETPKEEPEIAEPTNVISPRHIDKEEFIKASEQKKSEKKSKPIKINVLPLPKVQKISDKDHLSELNKKYGDLIKFNTWEDYYNSFSAEEKENKTKNGDYLLSAANFKKIRLDQAETIKRITQAEEEKREENRKELETEIENRKANIKENKQNIAHHKEEISRLRSENANLNEQNKVATDTIKGLNEESDKASAKIQEMDDIVEQLTPKDSKERVEQIYQEELAKMKAKREKQKAKKTETVASNKDMQEKLAQAFQTVEETKKAEEPKEEKNVVVTPQEENSLVGELSEEFENPEIEIKPVEQNIVLESTNPDYPGNITVSNGEVTPNWKTSPITSEENSEAVYAEAKRQSEIGQRALEIYSNNKEMTWEEARKQAEEELSTKEQTKGRTR